MDLFNQLLLTWSLTLAGSAGAAAAQNFVQRDDVRRSFIGGLAGGIVNAFVACALYLLVAPVLGGQP